MFDKTKAGIFGDIMLYWVADNAEWCAAYMPQEVYGYGDTQDDALLALRAALRLRRDEIQGFIGEMYPRAKATVIDLGTYRRHRARHAIQTSEPDRA